MLGFHGEDISAYQSGVPGGQSFVLVKCTEGTSYVNSKYDQWINQLHKNNILTGSYHFGHPKNSPTAEASHYLNNAQHKAGELLILDFETNDGFSASHCSQWGQEFCAEIKASKGFAPLVYTSLSFAWDGNCGGLGSYPLWIADPSSAIGSPRVPSPWKSAVMQQYSTAGGIDHDMFMGSKQDWLSLGGYNWSQEIMDSLPSAVKLGDQGFSVGVVQTLLNLWSNDPKSEPILKLDKVFGQTTKDRVIQEQRTHKLTPDGVVGKDTWNLLLLAKMP